MALIRPWVHGDALAPAATAMAANSTGEGEVVSRELRTRATLLRLTLRIVIWIRA